jgi:hypothetical protein
MVAAGNAAGEAGGLVSTGVAIWLGLEPGLAASGDGEGDLAARELGDAPMPHALTNTSIAARQANLRIRSLQP